MRDALSDERDYLTTLDDAAEVLRQATAFFASLDTQVAETIGCVRLEAIATLRRQGWSHQQIADACGLTRQRVSQLIRDAQSR